MRFYYTDDHTQETTESQIILILKVFSDGNSMG